MKHVLYLSRTVIEILSFKVLAIFGLKFFFTYSDRSRREEQESLFVFPLGSITTEIQDFENFGEIFEKFFFPPFDRSRREEHFSPKNHGPISYRYRDIP